MQLATTNPTLHQAFQVLNELSQKDEAWDEYERREKFFLDQLTNEREAYESGVRDTEERVMREADLKIKEIMIESANKINNLVKEKDEQMNKIAINLLGIGLTPEDVATNTGLSIEKVRQLMQSKS